MEQETNSVDVLTDEKASRKEKYNKAVELLAGSESNLEAVIKHYSMLDQYVVDYLKKVEEERNIKFDQYISEILVVDLFVNDMASFIGHVKITGSTILSKFMKGGLKEEEENKLFMKMVKIEHDLSKLMDTDYYEVILERQIGLLVEKANEDGFEHLVTSVSESDKDDESKQ